MAKSYRFYEFSVLKCNSNESATKGDNAMSKKIRTEAVDYLFQGILSLEDKEECYTFFEDICTINRCFYSNDQSCESFLELWK